MAAPMPFPAKIFQNKKLEKELYIQSPLQTLTSQVKMNDYLMCNWNFRRIIFHVLQKKINLMISDFDRSSFNGGGWDGVCFISCRRTVWDGVAGTLMVVIGGGAVSVLVVSVLVSVAVWWWAEAGEASCQPAEGASITLLSALPSTDIQLDFRLPLFTCCRLVIGNGGEKL